MDQGSGCSPGSYPAHKVRGSRQTKFWLIPLRDMATNIESEKIKPGEGLKCQNCFFHKDFKEIIKDLAKTKGLECGIEVLADLKEDRYGKESCSNFKQTELFTMEDIYFNPRFAKILIAITGSYPA